MVVDVDEVRRFAEQLSQLPLHISRGHASIIPSVEQIVEFHLDFVGYLCESPLLLPKVFKCRPGGGVDIHYTLSHHYFSSLRLLQNRNP